jgi:hypothetical protein
MKGGLTELGTPDGPVSFSFSFSFPLTTSRSLSPAFSLLFPFPRAPAPDDAFPPASEHRAFLCLHRAHARPTRSTTHATPPLAHWSHWDPHRNQLQSRTNEQDLPSLPPRRARRKPTSGRQRRPRPDACGTALASSPADPPPPFRRASRPSSGPPSASILCVEGPPVQPPLPPPPGPRLGAERPPAGATLPSTDARPPLETPPIAGALPRLPPPLPRQHGLPTRSPAEGPPSPPSARYGGAASTPYRWPATSNRPVSPSAEGEERKTLT